MTRTARLLWLKVLGTAAFMWAFFAAYFHLLRHPVHEVTVMPLTALDQAIAFQPAALAAYLSLWVYVSIPATLLRRFRELVAYALWIAAPCVIGLVIFYFWPTAVPPHGLDVSHLWAFATLTGVDAAGNACPSLHVATACFSAPWLDRLLREMRASAVPRVLNVLWLMAIVYSTLAIKQQVVLDVLAGAALGLAFAALSLRLQPAREASRRAISSSDTD